jgi:hypothetical protein
MTFVKFADIAGRAAEASSRHVAPLCGCTFGNTVEAIVQALSGRYLSTAMLEGI